jgi:glycosyltransferase involved in cell wall biosynthesis
MRQPKVSVVMPVYNGASYLAPAIESILGQTYLDFEFILINDGSIDNSVEIIQSYSDTRIRLLHNEKNAGLAAARNRGIDEAQGDFIAWLDCDDISLPTRLEKQVRFLESNPQIGACGTWVRLIGLVDEREWHHPTDPEFLRCRMLFHCPLAIPSTMIRRQCLIDLQLRCDPKYPVGEDYILWERLSRHCLLSNLAEVLTLYRLHQTQLSTVKAQELKDTVWYVQRGLVESLGIYPTEEEKAIHLELGDNWRFEGSTQGVEKARDWLEKLACANTQSHVFAEPSFTRVLAERWLRVCQVAARNGVNVWRTFRGSPLSRSTNIAVSSSAKIFIRSVLKLSVPHN